MPMTQNSHLSNNLVPARNHKPELQMALNTNDACEMALHQHQNAFNPSSEVSPRPRFINYVAPSSSHLWTQSYGSMQHQQISHGSPGAMYSETNPSLAVVPEEAQRQRFNVKSNSPPQHKQVVGHIGSGSGLMQLQQLLEDRLPCQVEMPPLAPPDLRVRHPENHPQWMAQHPRKPILMPQPETSIRQPRMIMPPPRHPPNFEGTQNMPIPSGCHLQQPAPLPHFPPQMQQPGPSTQLSSFPPPSQVSICGNHPGVPPATVTPASITKPKNCNPFVGVPGIQANPEPFRHPTTIWNNKRASPPVFSPSWGCTRPPPSLGGAAIPRENQPGIPPVAEGFQPSQTPCRVSMTMINTPMNLVPELDPFVDMRPPPTPAGTTLQTDYELQTDLSAIPKSFDRIQPPPTPMPMASNRQAGFPRNAADYRDIRPPPTPGGVRMPARTQRASGLSNLDYMRPPPTPYNPLQGDGQSVMSSFANGPLSLPKQNRGFQPNGVSSTSIYENITSTSPPLPPPLSQTHELATRSQNMSSHEVYRNGSQWLPTANIQNTLSPIDGTTPYMSRILPPGKVGPGDTPASEPQVEIEPNSKKAKKELDYLAFPEDLVDFVLERGGGTGIDWEAPAALVIKKMEASFRRLCGGSDL